MLAKEVVAEYGGRVRYKDEDFGASPLAERHGVKEYPAVFIDDELFAAPQEFHPWAKGFAGRYHPWSAPESHRKFQEDLRRAIEKRLAAGDGAADRFDQSGSPSSPAPDRRLPNATRPGS